MAGVMTTKAFVFCTLISQLFLALVLAGKSNHSSDPLQDSCSYQNARKERDLKNDCSADGKNFDSWIQKYTTSNDLYNKFTPCSESRILKEERTKMVIKFCYCYNFCGLGQTRNGCEVEGLEGRLDRGADLFSSYKAVCAIDCKPKDKLERISTLKNELTTGTVTQVISLTEGTTSIQTSQTGGTSSTTISAKIGILLKKVFSGELGVSKTTEYNWAQSSSSSFSRQVKHEARIPVEPGEQVSVCQVIGTCNNTDGTFYTVNTKTLVVRDQPTCGP